jgi:hypothetical protein
MKIELFKNLIKEAVREVLVEEFQLTKKPLNTTVKEETIIHSSTSGNTLQDVLLSTMKELSKKDYNNFLMIEDDLSNQNNNILSEVGLDISGLNFVQKASKIYKLSNEKDLLR